MKILYMSCDVAEEPNRLLHCCLCVCVCVYYLQGLLQHFSVWNTSEWLWWIQRRLDQSINQECGWWFARGDHHHSAFIQWVQFSVGDRHQLEWQLPFTRADTQPVTFQLKSLDHTALETTAGARHRQGLSRARFEGRIWRAKTTMFRLALVCFTEHIHEALKVNIWTERRGMQTKSLKLQNKTQN